MGVQSINVFCCYAHEDEGLLRDLMIHLQPLQRQGIINLWADIHINAGDEWRIEIDRHLNAAQIILLLVSPDFMSSDYCYSLEMQQAMYRHELGVTRVVPVILRPVFWQAAPFGKLQVLPPQARPIVHPAWHSKDEAFLSIVDGIRQIAEGFSVAVRNVPSFHSPQMFTYPTAASAPPLQNTFPQQGSIVQKPVGYVVPPTPSHQVSSFAIPNTMINEQVILQQVEQGNIPPEWNVFHSGKISTRPIVTPSIVFVTAALLCLLTYLSPGTSGSSPFRAWFNRLDVQAADKVTTYVERIKNGNTSNLKSVGGGVHECRIDWGVGYRIYLGKDGENLVVLLGGGTKRRQQDDINRAKLL